EGLYKANERFGPGVLTYAGHGQCKVQDIGWWCRDKLIRLCTRVEGAFSMHDHKEYKYFEEETHHQIDLSENESSDLFAHNATSYNYEHLPQTSKLKKELNQAFFGADYDLVCSDKLYTVIHTHRHQEKGLSFIPDEISTKERSFFDSKSGPLEHASRQLLLCAGAGDAHSVYSILKSGAADPNVADRQGNNPIISAATNCHLDVVNILLDMGANINQVNDQGTSSLSACHVFYYPVDHFKTNLFLASVMTTSLLFIIQLTFRWLSWAVRSRSAEKKPKKTKSSKVTEENSVTQDGSSSSDDTASCEKQLSCYYCEVLIQTLVRCPFHPSVCLLLNKGASTAFRLSDKGAVVHYNPNCEYRRTKCFNAFSVLLGGFNVLHVASGIMCSEGVKLVELLLHANADPNTCAHDRWDTYVYHEVKEMLGWGQECMGLSEDLGITALHIACHRDDNYKDACDVTHLLLNNAAKPDCIWTGHSPLSLAIASGNDLCVKKLLQFGADASLELSDGLGSALCVASDPQYEFRRSPEDRISLIDWLVKFGADMLAPIKFGSKQSTGTVVDYAHWLFNKDTRISRTPYHALNIKEREAYNARKNLLTHLGKLLRESAKNLDRRTTQENFSGSTEKQTSQVFSRIWVIFEGGMRISFKYCYECGRSVGVHLTSCTRCHEVYYCSRACKLKAWEERHKYEC
uniref:MYND-type domain-containing protein n=1 Tax=Ciona savignyi TaxID=51511 RepID=H2ZD10_CIOSA